MLYFEKIPFVFANNTEHYRQWRRLLGQLLGVDPQEIVIVGSAAVGCSCNPHKALSPFDDASDIDVAIVSERYFSEAWHHLRTVDLALDVRTGAQRESIKDHRQRLIYWGCVATDKILALLPFAVKWMEARSKMAGAVPTIGRLINFRIYKDFAALRAYQMNCLQTLKTKLVPG